MSIKYLNIRSREVRIAETEPHITALWASSDRSPNITQGQDFGWRLAPEVVVEMKQIKQDPMALQQIAIRYNLPLDAVGEPEILEYISSKTDAENAPVADIGDYQDDYDQEIRRIEKEEHEKKKAELESLTPAAAASENPDNYPVVIGGIRYTYDPTEPTTPIYAVHDATFQNLQESPAGFGRTKDEALAAYRLSVADLVPPVTTTTTTKVK